MLEAKRGGRIEAPTMPLKRYDLLEDDLSSASYDDVLSALQGFRDEAERVEFKSEMPDRSRLVQTACAFANAFGGIIAVGLNDADASAGLQPASAVVNISNSVQTAALSRIQARTYPSVRCQAFGFRSDSGHAIMLIRIQRTTIGPHQYLGNDGPPLPVRRDKQIAALSLAEIEALQQRRDGGSLTTSPLGVHTMHFPIMPPITKRNTNNQQLSFFGATIFPQEFSASTRILYEDDETDIRTAVSRCVGLSGVRDRTLRDGLLFSTDENPDEDARFERDVYVQSDGEIALRMEYTKDDELYQICRFLGNVVVLASYTYAHLGLIPRIRGTLRLEINETSDDFLPRHGSESFSMNMAAEDVVAVTGDILTLLLRGSNRASRRDEMREVFKGVWEREFLSRGVVDPRTLWR